MAPQRNLGAPSRPASASRREPAALVRLARVTWTLLVLSFCRGERYLSTKLLFSCLVSNQQGGVRE